LRKPEETH